MYRKIFFIDINILKQIERNNKNIINKIDKYQTLVSIWFTLYESIIYHRSIKKVEELLLENSKILNNNLKKSKHDTNFFIENKKLLKNIFDSILQDNTLQNYTFS